MRDSAKVWAILECRYDDTSLVGVFNSEARAQEYVSEWDEWLS
jgi:hypothetical protein